MQVSVVIPSLGGNLDRMLKGVVASSIPPSEIIICLPNNSHIVKNAKHYKNLKIVYADRYGQVYQRVIGFKSAKSDYVLQLDDDIVLDEQCLEQLIASLKALPRQSTVSPCLFNVNGRPLYERKKQGMLSFYYRLVNGSKGYKPGEVTRAGTNFGINPSEVTNKLVEVDWQPGGCVLHRKENLILSDYYPNKGKAYCEDLIHSHLLRHSGVKLFVDTHAKCTTPLNPALSIGKEIVPDFKARLYFVKLANLSIARMLIHYMVYVVRSLKSK